MQIDNVDSESQSMMSKAASLNLSLPPMLEMSLMSDDARQIHIEPVLPPSDIPVPTSLVTDDSIEQVVNDDGSDPSHNQRSEPQLGVPEKAPSDYPNGGDGRQSGH